MTDTDDPIQDALQNSNSVVRQCSKSWSLTVSSQYINRYQSFSTQADDPSVASVGTLNLATDMDSTVPSLGGFFDVLKGAALAGLKAVATTLIPAILSSSAQAILQYNTDGVSPAIVPVSQTWVYTPSTMTAAAGKYTIIHITNQAAGSPITNLRVNGSQFNPVARYAKKQTMY